MMMNFFSARSAIAAALLLVASLLAAPAQAENSPEAAAAAKRHLSEKQGAQPASQSDAAPAPAPMRTSQRAAGGDWAARLASCKAQAGMNPIKREQCVWSNCNGHWGEGDCPPGSDWPPKFEKPKFEKFGTTPAAK